jgi:hypothetical protein
MGSRRLFQPTFHPRRAGRTEPPIILEFSPPSTSRQADKSDLAKEKLAGAMQTAEGAKAEAVRLVGAVGRPVLCDEHGTVILNVNERDALLAVHSEFRVPHLVFRMRSRESHRGR